MTADGPTGGTFGFPASHGQRRLWFLDQLAPGQALYNLHTATPIDFAPDLDALQRSLQEIVRRHESLRTRFEAMDGEPTQVVMEQMELPLPLVDLSHLDQRARDAQVLHLTTEEARRPFDLARGPLIRTSLIRRGEADHVLMVTMHHIVSDGWSMGVFGRELATLYATYAAGKTSPLAELPIQYADYAVWQRGWLEGEALQAQLHHWQQQLEDLTQLQLPTDRARPATQSFRGDQCAFKLPGRLRDRLLALGRAEGATLFMTLLAAFVVLLKRYSGQDDIVVGCPISGRNRAETEGLIGFFVNTLVMRTDLGGDPGFLTLLGRVRETALAAYDHQDVPFEMLVDALSPDRDLSRNPLFQVGFVLHAAPAGATRSSTPSSAISAGTPAATPADPALTVSRGTALFDLALHLWDGPQGLTGHLEFSVDLFDTDTIQRLLGHFRTLLDAVVDDPRQAVSRLPMLTASERRQLLLTWNDTSTVHPVDGCIPAMFEAQAEIRPDAVALMLGSEALSCGELNRRANQLAHRLRRLGVGPDVLVALCVERSFDMVVGVLGILKAGGALVPLDPAYPPERLSFMLSDAGAAVVVTQATLLHGALGELLQASCGGGSRLVCLDRDAVSLQHEHALNPSGPALPHHLAYVIYTSGSTGVPKGVLVEHRGLPNVVAAQARLLGVRADDRILQFASLSFDAAMFELVMALALGGTACLGTRDSLMPGPALTAVLRDLAVTVMTLPPSALALLAPEDLPGVRIVCVAGEACPAELAQAWSAGRQFFNLYGPTEATIWSTAWTAPASGGPPTIGRPIINTRVRVLDAADQLVPIGVPGELHIGGVGVARAYLDRPTLTAERFIADPLVADALVPDALVGDHFGEGPDARLYKTGDLVRWRPNGELEFLGRLDHQVKLRGHRIEPGEIETMLAALAGVQQAVVLAIDDASGGKRLVAHIVPSDSETPPDDLVARWRSALQARLPAVMVPAHFRLIEALPLTSNGKVDRPALARSGLIGDALQSKYAAPRTAVEQALVEVWAEVLKRPRVGIHDQFFTELGGHSLLATQLISRVRERLALELPLRTLFESPTVAGMADSISLAHWLLDPGGPDGPGATGNDLADVIMEEGEL